MALSRTSRSQTLPTSCMLGISQRWGLSTILKGVETEHVRLQETRSAISARGAMVINYCRSSWDALSWILAAPRRLNESLPARICAP